MSQMVTRQSATDEKDKRQTDSPVKEMKKKMAANVEKEKQAAEKSDKPEKVVEKGAEKSSEKKVEKNGGVDKSDKKTESKQPEKKENGDKKEENKGEKSGKPEPKPSKEKPKGNQPKAQNGVSEHTNGAEGANGGASEEDEDVMLVIDDDDVYPELTYDDTSDAEGFEPPTPDPSSRSLTRRSQVKTTRTPETPRPASDKQPGEERTAADDKDTKILKLKDDAATDRKLRSADSPKRDGRKSQDKKDKSESPKKQDKDEKENAEKTDKDIEVIIEVEDEGRHEDDEGGEGASRKPDTNYSKSRVKVSPYRRSARQADLTTTSVTANYTGNNTTMEMDITESSIVSEEPSLDDSSFLSGLRNIRGRRSYKLLKDMPIRQVNRSLRSAANVSASDQAARPTGTVVGRKRKPDAELGIDVVSELSATAPTLAHTDTHSAKRTRLLDRIPLPFRRHHDIAAQAQIVGINSDLPQSAPVATPPAPVECVSLTPQHDDRDSKRCAIM